MSRCSLAVFNFSLNSYFLRTRDYVSSWWVAARQQSQIKLTSSRRTTAAFQEVDRKKGFDSDLDRNAHYWWALCGYSLSILLERAGYPNGAQYKILEFVRAITPSLGPRLPSTSLPRWKSFMTDNYVPIELSWDWRTDGQPPKIRFSIEPVGVHAGTHLDPRNQYASAQLQEIMARVLPDTNAGWLNHFQSQLNGKEIQDLSNPVEGHMSKEFYAFDLNSDGSVMVKAYLFPGFKAMASAKSNFDIITDTIRTAPDCTPDKLSALARFQEYVHDPSSPRLEMDMLAIDLVSPANSRFKLYFRIRDTSFASIEDTMTLGGRIQTPDVDQALVDLRRLYYALAKWDVVQGRMLKDNVQLEHKNHRTAGILYNVEFKYSSKRPKVKVYLPVRHFAHSEETIISTLDAYFQQTQRSKSWKSNMTNYKEALTTIFSDKALRAHDGVQTYLGCSVEGNSLRLVSYINPGASRDIRDFDCGGTRQNKGDTMAWGGC